MEIGCLSISHTLCIELKSSSVEYMYTTLHTNHTEILSGTGAEHLFYIHISGTLLLIKHKMLSSIINKGYSCN